MQSPDAPPGDPRCSDLVSRFAHVPELLRLSDRQRTAVVLLVLGERIGKVAQKLRVSRTTVWRWRQDDDFRRALDKSRELAFSDAIDQIGALAPRAVDRLARQIDSGHAAAPIQLLRLLHVDRHFWE